MYSGRCLSRWRCPGCCACDPTRGAAPTPAAWRRPCRRRRSRHLLPVVVRTRPPRSGEGLTSTNGRPPFGCLLPTFSSKKREGRGVGRGEAPGQGAVLKESAYVGGLEAVQGPILFEYGKLGWATATLFWFSVGRTSPLVRARGKRRSRKAKTARTGRVGKPTGPEALARAWLAWQPGSPALPALVTRSVR